MTSAREPPEASMACSVALAVIAEWLRQNAPDTCVGMEVEPGEWQTVNLLRMAEGALAAFRDEHGGPA